MCELLVYVHNELINLFMMALFIQQSKRIKLEHSYSLTEGPVTIKEEDPLSLSEYSDIKIEITDTNLIKTEPLEENGDEYLNITNTNEIENNFLADQCVVRSSTQVLNNSEFRSSSNLDCALNSCVDPLQIVKNEFVEQDPLLLEDQEKTESRSCNLNNQGSNELGPPAATEKENEFVEQDPLLLEDPEKTESRSCNSNKHGSNELGLLSAKKNKTKSLQKQISKLKMELKAAISREKELQMELGARRKSEICLEQSNAEVKGKMQECLKREMANAKLMKGLAHKLVLTQKENVLRTENTDRVRKELTEKMDQMKTQLTKKEMEYKKLDVKCGSLTQDLARLTAKFNIKKIELQQVKNKSTCNEKLLNENVRVLQGSQHRISELTKEVLSVRRNNEELQKSLMTEKKMSRYLIKERDQLLEQQDARFLDADKELNKLKEAVAMLTKALSQKMMECQAQRKAAKSAAAEFERQNQELQSKVKELEQKQEELANKTCEYCGFN